MSSESTSEAPQAVTVLVYSDDANTRQKVTFGMGRRPASDLPRVTYVECATEPAVIARLDAGGIDLCVLDGEATPAGGMGICRQIKDEIYRCPPVLLLTGRVQDNWLAAWSRADAVVAHPVDPVELVEAAVTLLRQRLSQLPVR